MPSGVELLLKSLGFDPDEIRTKIVETTSNLKTLLEDLNRKIAGLDARLDRIEGQLCKMNQAPLQPHQPPPQPPQPNQPQ
jgi:hypothetical protein